MKQTFMSLLGAVVLLTITTTTAQDKSVYDDIPEFGGPGSVGVELKEDNRASATGDFVKDGLPGWFTAKEEMVEQHGLAYGLNLSTLYQGASESLGEDRAWGGIVQLPASWTVLNRGEKNTGTIVFKLENRSRISTDLAPQDLGIQGVGAASVVGTQFSDKDWILTNLYWQQTLQDGRVKFSVGHIDNTDFMDTYGLVNPQTAFMNLSFSTNPTIGVPDQGFGAGFGALLSDNFYVAASLMDAAGDPEKPGDSIDQFFDEGEYFKHVEFGYILSPDRIYFIDDMYMPFLRIGDSDGGGGALLEKTVTAGLGIYYGESGELFGAGISYGEASEDPVGGFGSDLDPQYTAEVFYRFQLSQHLAITPDLQWIVDPVLNPDEDSIFIAGARARLSL